MREMSGDEAERAEAFPSSDGTFEEAIERAKKSARDYEAAVADECVRYRQLIRAIEGASEPFEEERSHGCRRCGWVHPDGNADGSSACQGDVEPASGG